jgi:hypothetical protein
VSLNHSSGALFTVIIFGELRMMTMRGIVFMCLSLFAAAAVIYLGYHS